MTPEMISRLVSDYGPTVVGALLAFVLGILSALIIWVLKNVQTLIVTVARLETAFTAHKEKTEKDVNGIGDKVKLLESQI